MSTTIPRAEFFLVVEELVLLEEVVLGVPLEVALLPDGEPEEEPGVLVGAGDVPGALTSKSELLAYTWVGSTELMNTT